MSREQYVKPVVMQLHYATDPQVTIALACKTTGSASGAAASGCLTAQSPIVPCSTPGT